MRRLLMGVSVLGMFACSGSVQGGGQDLASGPDLSQPPQPPHLASPPPDLSPAVTAAPHAGTAVLSGGVTAKSGNYKIIMSTGQSPGGNGKAASGTVQKNGGL